MIVLRPIKMPSAKERVAAELRKAILSRQMKEGEVLSLESVASQLNVSAMPVREAFQILARDGLIQLRKNKAAVVLGVTETYIKEHYQLRAILELSLIHICTACLKECHTGAILYFLGADMGGMGSMLSVKEKGDVRIWRVDSPNGETKTIEINMKDSNKY